MFFLLVTNNAKSKRRKCQGPLIYKRVQRVTVVLAHKVALSHPCDRDIPFILNIPAAGNGLDCRHGLT